MGDSAGFKLGIEWAAKQTHCLYKGEGRMRPNNLALILGLCVLPVLVESQPLKAQTSQNLDFLGGLPDFEHVATMLPDYLNRIALALLAERGKEVSRISSPEYMTKRKAYLRQGMLRALGGLPERTPLNAKVAGLLSRDGYRIEKIIFESQPHFYVTGNLYLPTTGQPPYPAVLFPLGHERGGKSNPTWQQVLVTLAKKGYVAFTWDPLGQGERSQFYDPDLGTSKLGETGYTTEHTMLGAQCLLVGDNLARYTIWDGIRALDYLVSRKEVDPSRVACTGNSGGGTHTAYLSALDDRIKVAMPSCYITSWRRLLESIGPQDAEQCLPPWLADGLDHGDFVESFAPKPFLMLNAIRDFFSISGARETFEEAQRIYGLMGAADKLDRFEADDGHGYSAPRRQAAYRWLARWLKGSEDPGDETLVTPEADSDLRCTESGQVSVSLGGETVFSLNQKRVEQNVRVRPRLTDAAAVESLRKDLHPQLRRMIGFKPEETAPGVKPFGTIRRPGYRIEKLICESEPGIIVPALLFVPEPGENRRPAVLYFNSRGKSAGAEPGDDIEQLVHRGFVVLAIDARGTGETRPSQNPDEANETYRLFGDYGNAMEAFLIGRTLVGMRAVDVSRGVDLLTARAEVDASRISGFGVGAGAVALLHEALLDDRIKEVVLKEMLVSYRAVTSQRLHHGLYESIVPGALRVYDLPDLVATLAPRPVWIVNATDPLGKRIGTEEAEKAYGLAREGFRALAAEPALHIVFQRPEEPLKALD
jgi:cephalosporin-C deacetylase-like acetyl esterase